MYERWSEPAGWPAGVLTDADRRRFARYADALAFFDGEQWTGRARRGETRLTFNYARALIRKIAAYVYPAPVAFNVPIPEGSDVAAETANRAERLLAATAAELDLGRLDVDLCFDAAILGDAAVKVTWGGRAGRPVVAPVDPATLAVACAADDPRRPARVTQVYALPASALADLGLTSGAAGRLIAFPGSDRRPLAGEAGEPLAPIVETWTAERWRMEAAGQIVRDEANPYGWIPYVIAPNNPRPSAFWGESDLTDLYDVCRELNGRLSVLSKVLEVSGSPVAVLENVDGSEGIAVGPGAKWELPEGAKAYLLDLLSGGGVGLHVQYVDLLYRALHDLSETPRTAFGDSGRNLSGAALEVEIQPLVQKVGRKRRQWEAFHRARNARLLDLLERFGGEPLAELRRTETIWPPILPSDRAEAVRNATQLTASGIQSRRTAAATLGHDDPEREWAAVLAEMAAMRDVGERRAGKTASDGERSRGVEESRRRGNGAKGPSS